LNEFTLRPSLAEHDSTRERERERERGGGRERGRLREREREKERERERMQPNLPNEDVCEATVRLD
jgi:hypothetical protein